MSNIKLWGFFILLSAIWGSSYFFIKIAGRELTPFTLVTVRLGFGAAGLWALMALQRLRPPSDRATLLKTTFIGFLNTALPFVLITWAEKYIDSGVTGIVNSSVPIFTLLIAHFTLHNEKITWLRVGGLLVGFGGVAVIFSEGIGQALTQGITSASGMVLLGELAVTLAAVCYGASSVFTRRMLTGVHPTVTATMQVTSAFIFTLIGTLVTESPVKLAMGGLTLLSVAWLGLLGSCIAYLLYFTLIREWGATRTTLVTYVIPVVSVALGALILHEKTGWQLMIGFALIAGGIALVNRRPRAVESAAPVLEASGR